MDLTKLDSVKNTINSFKPNIIINCAAYTHVDNAETNREDCRNSNVLGLNNLLKSVDKNLALIRLQKFQKLSEKIKYNYKNELLGKTIKVLIKPTKLIGRHKFYKLR